ncbi:TadE/TadG family type IV pilus assembly protein [Methylobacterium sp. JK268]
MAARPPLSLRRPGPRPSPGGLIADRRGVTMVEFALLAWPTVMLILFGLQLALVQYTQVGLSNALFDTASAPEPAVLAGDQPGYKAVVCARIGLQPAQACAAGLLVEMAPLALVPTAAQPIQGTTFLAGLPMNVMLLRAAAPVVQILPFLPIGPATASVVFRRS